MLAGALLVASCGTSLVETASAPGVPAERVIAPALLVAGIGTGTLIVKRDSGSVGSACSSRLFLDAKSVADIEPSEKIVLHLPQGEYQLGAEPNGACAGGLRETQVLVRVNDTVTYRIGYGNDDEDFFLLPTAF
jgi:hypothetical protein